MKEKEDYSGWVGGVGRGIVYADLRVCITTLGFILRKMGIAREGH